MPSEFERLRSTQHDVLSRAQLTALGIDHDRVAREVLARRWREAGPLAVVLHNGPLTVEQRRWVATLNGGVLAAATALEGYGLVGYESEQVHVLVRKSARYPNLDGVVVHESRRLRPGDVHPSRSPATVRVERAAIDTAAWAMTDRTACAVLAAAVQQRLTTAPRLLAELATVGRVRRRRLLRAVLGDIEGGAQALSELDFVSLCRRSGLPEPVRQAVRIDANGLRRFLDADFETFTAEVDGGIHLRPLNAWADASRRNALVLAGERLLTFPSVVMRIDEPAVVATLRQAIARFGTRAA